MTILKYGWCRKEFEKDTGRDKHGEFPVIVCPHCAQTLPGSRKESAGNVVGRKHIHIPYKDGDIAG